MSTSGKDVRDEQIKKLALEIEIISKELNKNLELIKAKIKEINEAVANKATVDEKIISEYKELNKKIQKQKEEINNRIGILKDREGSIGLSSEEFIKLEMSRAQSKEWEEFAKLSKHEKNHAVILPEPEFTPEAKKLLTSPNLTPPKPPVPIAPKVIAKLPNTTSKWDETKQKDLYNNMGNSVKLARNNYKELKDMQFSVNDKQSGLMTVKSLQPNDKVDFSVSSHNGSDNISGKVTDENLTAMSVAIISNLHTKLKDDPKAALFIDLKGCTPPEVAKQFLDKINAERERFTNTLMTSNDPNDKVLAEKLKSVQTKMPDIPTVTAHIQDNKQPNPNDLRRTQSESNLSNKSGVTSPEGSNPPVNNDSGRRFSF